jgi:hypothetical protein
VCELGLFKEAVPDVTSNVVGVLVLPEDAVIRATMVRKPPMELVDATVLVDETLFVAVDRFTSTS